MCVWFPLFYRWPDTSNVCFVRCSQYKSRSVLSGLTGEKPPMYASFLGSNTVRHLSYLDACFFLDCLCPYRKVPLATTFFFFAIAAATATYPMHKPADLSTGKHKKKTGLLIHLSNANKGVSTINWKQNRDALELLCVPLADNLFKVRHESGKLCHEMSNKALASSYARASDLSTAQLMPRLLALSFSNESNV